MAIMHIYGKSKKKGKGQQSMQSSTTPETKYVYDKTKLTLTYMLYLCRQL